MAIVLAGLISSPAEAKEPHVNNVPLQWNKSLKENLYPDQNQEKEWAAKVDAEFEAESDQLENS